MVLGFLPATPPNLFKGSWKLPELSRLPFHQVLRTAPYDCCKCYRLANNAKPKVELMSGSCVPGNPSSTSTSAINLVALNKPPFPGVRHPQHWYDPGLPCRTGCKYIETICAFGILEICSMNTMGRLSLADLQNSGYELGTQVQLT